MGYVCRIQVGVRVIERLAAIALFLYLGSVAAGAVTTTVYLADENMPLEWADPNVPFVYRDIMVGTKLTIVVSSDANESWDGALQIAEANRDYGSISARDYNDVTRDWEGSPLEAAGVGARVRYSADSVRIAVSLRTGDIPVPGDWFVIDYTATNVGVCSVGFFELVVEPCSNCGPFNPPPAYDVLIHELVFSHVPTRDFVRDAKVDFVDFAVLTSFMGVTSCADLNFCEGTDLDTDGDVDRDDLMLFADYWLERTE